MGVGRLDREREKMGFWRVKVGQLRTANCNHGMGVESHGLITFHHWPKCFCGLYNHGVFLSKIYLNF